jgi:hypothetical protein
MTTAEQLTNALAQLGADDAARRSDHHARIRLRLMQAQELLRERDREWAAEAAAKAEKR